MYLRVGAVGSGHSRFIYDVAKTRNLTVFSKSSAKTFSGLSQKESEMVLGRKRRDSTACARKAMVAFDGIKQKNMCRAGFILFLQADAEIDTYVFSVYDQGMKKGEVDADDVLRQAFGKVDFELYRKITEIHHMLSDGTIRILACGGAKLADPIVLTYDECLAREVARGCQ